LLFFQWAAGFGLFEAPRWILRPFVTPFPRATPRARVTLTVVYREPTAQIYTVHGVVLRKLGLSRIGYLPEMVGTRSAVAKRLTDRANIVVVTDVVSCSTCGLCKARLPSRRLGIGRRVVDRAYARASSFFDALTARRVAGNQTSIHCVSGR
jgi:hypothetical protein